MSKTASAPFLAHIAQTCTTLATLWRVTRTDGEAFHFTDHDRDITINVDDVADTANAKDFRADSGFTRTSISNTSSLSVDNMEIESVLSTDGITESDVRSGRWDLAEVEVYMVNWDDLTMGVMQLRRGFLGEVSLRDEIYFAELRGLTQLLQQVIGDVYTPNSRADHGDSKCKFDLATTTETTKVDAIAADNRTITVPDGAEVDGEFLASADVFFKIGVQVNSPTSITILRRTTVEDGTFRNPFLVSTTTDLTDVRDDLHAWYALANDVDMTAFGLFTPIGTIAAPFRGGLDGRGYTVSNLDLDHSAAPLAEEVGLFGRITSNAVLRRIGLAGVDLDNGATSTLHKGCLVGFASGNVFIEDCFVDNSGSGNVQTGGDRAGGLVGLVENVTTLRRCLASTPFTGALGTRVGGLVGEDGTGGGANSLSVLFQDTTVGITNLGLNVAATEVAAAVTSVLQARATYGEPTGTGVPESVLKDIADLLPSRASAFFDFFTVWSPPVVATSYPVLRQWY